MKSSFVRTGVAVLAALALHACDDSTSPDGTAQLTVLLTDAPSMYLDSAWVDIGAVELIGGDDGPILLSDDGTDGYVDLMQLQGVATQALRQRLDESGELPGLRARMRREKTVRFLLGEGPGGQPEGAPAAAVEPETEG